MPSPTQPKRALNHFTSFAVSVVSDPSDQFGKILLTKGSPPNWLVAKNLLVKKFYQLSIDLSTRKLPHF